MPARRRIPPRQPRQNPPQASEGGDAGRFGGYGQQGYCEQEANTPGVQSDFDEEENRVSDQPAHSRSEHTRRPSN
jgi:hypothetical protein